MTTTKAKTTRTRAASKPAEAVKTEDMVFDKEGNMTIEPVEYYGVNYSSIIPVLINAVQEQQELIKALEVRIAELEK